MIDSTVSDGILEDEPHAGRDLLRGIGGAA
jgi:hypothetical protein